MLTFLDIFLLILTIPPGDEYRMIKHTDRWENRSKERKVSPQGYLERRKGCSGVIKHWVWGWELSRKQFAKAFYVQEPRVTWGGSQDSIY